MEPYVCYGIGAETGDVKIVSPLKEGSLIQYVTDTGTDTNSYYCDYHISRGHISGGIVLYCGGDRMYAGRGGLWNYTETSVSTTGRDIGGRLCYKPSVT